MACAGRRWLNVARYQHLPVYQLSYSLVRESYHLKAKLPKLLKYDLGSDISRSCLRVLKGAILANSHAGVSRVRILVQVSLEVEVLWTYYRLLYDLKGISGGEFQVISERLIELGSQINAWLKWAKKNS